jgi:protein involved in ribonucleotide reduction
LQGSAEYEMVIAYASMTGNVARFINKLKDKLPNAKYVKVVRQMSIDEPFVLITYTTGFGEVPKEVSELLKNSGNNLVAVAGSGNRNWGDMFCRGAKTIAKEYNVPLIHTFELSGYDSDAEIIASKIKELQKG